nr:DNA helicase [Tanacetum cinerariifolium]
MQQYQNIGCGSGDPISSKPEGSHHSQNLNEGHHDVAIEQPFFVIFVVQNKSVLILQDIDVNLPDIQISLGIQQLPSNNSDDVSSSASHSSAPLSPPTVPQEFNGGTSQTGNHDVPSALPSNYKSVGRCQHSCEYCGALFWYEERLKSIGRNRGPKYGRCCKGGRVVLRTYQIYPDYIKLLLNDRHFMDNIRAYNQMFSMTSLGAHIDESVNNGHGPYVFKISGQLYHWLGSLCPAEGDPPRFLQLYIYDTDNEVDNRMSHFGGQNSELRRDIVGLIDMLDTHNALVHLFRTAREKLADTHIPNFKVRLYNVVGAREYELPTGDMLGAIVYEPGLETEMDYDIIIEQRSGHPQRVNKIHSSYMSLQFPLLFPYGEDGYSTDLKLVGDNGTSGSRTTYLEQEDSFSNTSHYLDALAICRVHANPSFFITFTCNVKWPEITDYMAQFPLLTTTDRANIVDRVFEMKIQQFIKYLGDAKPFGRVVAVLYTVEFQKRGLPHCHTLVWIHKGARIHRDEDIDAYISAELPPLDVDPECHRIVSELMIHGPCGLACPSAPCMQNVIECKKHFPKEYSNHSYTDKEGFVHYRRRNTGVTVLKQHIELDNCFVVPYNRDLLTRFYAHINVEHCAWTMLIKYLFKNISKGTDRIVARISTDTTRKKGFNDE